MPNSSDMAWLETLIRVVIPLGSLTVAFAAWRASTRNTRATQERTALTDVQAERNKLQARVEALEQELSRAQEQIVRLVMEGREPR